MSITLKGLGTAVDSVNGKTGIVVLSPEDLGADSAGAASAVITQHEAAADPHPQYLTQSEGDALYQPIGSGGGGGTSETIRTPVAVAPLTGTTEFPVDGTLQASPYAPLYSADAREFREFQIDIAAGDFTSPVAAAQVDADTWDISPSTPDNTDLKWRCRDKSLKGDYSDWSEPQTFKTYDIYVVTPVITSPTEGGTVAERDQPITSSEFQIVNASDTHAASYWTIKDSFGAVAYQAGRDTVNLTSWQPPLGVIADGEAMTVEVVYESASGFLSEAGVRGFVGVGIGYGKVLALGTDTPPYIQTYGIDEDTFNSLAVPDNLPPGNRYGVAFSPDGEYLALPGAGIPQITIYRRYGNSIAKLAGPDVLPTGIGNGVAFSSDGTYLAVSHATSPYITIYARDGDTFTKIPDPSILPTGNGNGVAFSPDGAYLAVTHNTTPFITIYKREGATFTKIANPNVLPTGIGRGVTFSPDGTHMVVGHQVAPYLIIYKRSGDTFTRVTTISPPPTASCRSVTFSPDGSHMAVGTDVSPYVLIYERSGDTFTRLPDPDVLPSNIVYGVAFSSDGEHLSTGGPSTPFITIYKKTGGVFTKLPDPGVLPTGRVNGVAFWP